MQLAALAAVVSYFWSDVRQLAVGSLSALMRADFKESTFSAGAVDRARHHPIGLAGLALAAC